MAKPLPFSPLSVISEKVVKEKSSFKLGLCFIHASLFFVSVVLYHR